MLAPIANQTVNEGQLLQFTVTATDPDGDALTFAGANLPTGATLTDHHNGTATFSWTPSFTQAGNYPNAMVIVTDSGTPPASASQSFTITVGTVNRPPILAPIGNRTATPGLPLSITMTASDPDGDALSFAATNVPAGASFVDNHNGTATFSWTPDSTQTGTHSMTVTVTDAGTPPLSASETFTITVLPPPTGGGVDLHIVKFRVNRSVYLGGEDDSSVHIRLVVKNNGTVNQSRPATVVGVQNGREVFRQTRLVSAPIGRSATYRFRSFKPWATGDITWTITVANDSPHGDHATAVTHVGRRRSEGERERE